MIKSSVEKLSEEIGYDIGMSDDEVQAKLLNGFSTALCNSIRQENDIDFQLCAIVRKLDVHSHKIIKRLHEFIELKEKNKEDN